LFNIAVQFVGVQACTPSSLRGGALAQSSNCKGVKVGGKNTLELWCKGERK